MLFLLLPLQALIRFRFDGVPDGIHMLGFSVPKLLIHITQRTRGTKQSPCLFRLKLQLLHTHYDVLPHRVFVGVVEDFGRLLMQ